MAELFRHVMVETYRDPSRPYPRVRPCSGQGLNTHWNIRFPRDLRKQFQVGQKFYCDLAEGRNQYMLKGEIELIQKVTFSHGGKKVKEEIAPATPSGPPKKVQKVKDKDKEPKIGQRKLKF